MGTAEKKTAAATPKSPSKMIDDSRYTCFAERTHTKKENFEVLCKHVSLGQP